MRCDEPKADGQLSHNAMQDLLGAYALDAVDGDEAETIELHLRGCPRCRAEVADYREVAATLVALLGVHVFQQGQRIDGMQSALEDRTALAAALTAHGDPHARETALRSKAGVVFARAVVVRDGTGYLWTNGLPDLHPGRIYQLWAIIGTERISVGVLGASPQVAPFRVAGDIVGFAITDEVSGGVVASENQPVASGLVVQN